ncbi:MAG: heparinase II/III family protein, partial [Hyphomicrobiaceae bacterium]
TAAERAELAALAARRAGRAAAARALRSPALRWWLTPAYADELLIVPQDLRTLDPSFLSEIAADQFGLAGTLVSLGGFSPFALPPPHGAWARELHGFGWLRHLRAANHDDAQVAARAFATSWLMLERRHADIAFEPTVVARRIISWISHADLLLEGSDQKDYLAMAGSLGVDIQLLAATWRNAQDGYPRLLTLAAQVLAGLCVARLERRLARAQTLLVAEIERQILADGGHVTRNPGVLVDILLDFLPLRQCYAAREATPPPEFQAAISRMIAFVKSMRLGDGTLARFNGVSCTEADALATALSYEETDNPPLAAMPDSGYYRLACGKTVVIVDVGTPPPLELAGDAHAGCLSFEMSDGARAVLINGGAPSIAHEIQRSLARATASHNTLCLNTTSSSRLVRAGALERALGAAPLRLPNDVDTYVGDDPGSMTIEATHDGYFEQYRLLHTRRLSLSRDGRRLAGIDGLAPARGVLRMRRDLPFAVHFHVPSDAVCRYGPTPDTAEVQVAIGAVWRFTAAGARLSIEESTDFAHLSGPQRSMQIVLRGACPGETIVTWSFERMTIAAPVAAGPEPGAIET